MTQDANKPRRTIFILSIPGGAMLGTIPAVMMARLENLTETPVSELFQVMDGVSTGSIPIASLNVRDENDPSKPKFTAIDMVEKYSSFGPKFFPEIPMRWSKMFTANILNMIEDTIDPLKADEQLIEDIEGLFNELNTKAAAKQKPLIKNLHKLVTSRWMHNSDKKKALKLCKLLAQQDPALETLATNVGELTFLRTTTGLISSVFRRVALKGINTTRKVWAHDFKYDSTMPQKTYRELFGEMRMDQCIRSTYISAYDVKNNRIWMFYNRKHDLFSLDPKSPSTVSRENSKLWDAVMASTANPFAFKPHMGENGVLYSDKAIVHTPLNCVLDVSRHKPDDADIKLVILGTGKYISREKNGEPLRDEYERYGIAGGLMQGRETAEIQGYAMSAARNILRTHLGKDNIIELVPRLAPRPDEDINDMPSRNPLNASDENMRRILGRAFSFAEEEDEKIRKLARMLVDNLHVLGQMDDAKYNRLVQKIDNPDPEDIKKFRTTFADIEKKFAPKDPLLLPPPVPEQNNAPPTAQKKKPGGPSPS